MSDDLRDLYQERAEYADMESSLQDMKKFVRHSGMMWRLADWFQRYAVRCRQSVQEEINDLTRGGRT